MHKIIVLYILLASLVGCAFDESQLLIPKFGEVREIEPPQANSINWNDLSYSELNSVVNDSLCSMIYVTHVFCQDCDEVNKEIFKDFDTVETIRYSFLTYRVNQDNKDWQIILNLFNQKDVPIIVFLHHEEITLWNSEAELISLRQTINDLAKECQVGHNY